MATRIAIAGAGGRGAGADRTVLADPSSPCRRRSTSPGPFIGRDAGERCGRATGIVVGSDIEERRAPPVCSSISRGRRTLAHLDACARHGTAAVVHGTFRFSEGRLAAFAQRVPIVFAPNMSVGVNVLLSLVDRRPKRLGASYDIEILEMHHRHKVDAPSGTAIALGEPAARVRPARSPTARSTPRGRDRRARTGAGGFRRERYRWRRGVFAGTGERVGFRTGGVSTALRRGGAARRSFRRRAPAAGRTGLASMRDVLELG